ncbi:hypothetical protein LguiA_009487 [Lonicera macranthoides]
MPCFNFLLPFFLVFCTVFAVNFLAFFCFLAIMFRLSFLSFGPPVRPCLPSFFFFFFELPCGLFGFFP